MNDQNSIFPKRTRFIILPFLYAKHKKVSTNDELQYKQRFIEIQSGTYAEVKKF